MKETGTLDAARMLMCGVGEGKGYAGPGAGLNGCGPCGSAIDGAERLLFTDFSLLYCGCNG